MKKLTYCALALTMLFSLTACGESAPTPEPPPDVINPTPELDVTPELELPTLIDISTVENHSEYTYVDTYTMGTHGGLDATILIRDGTGTNVQTISYATDFDQDWYNTYTDNGGVMYRFVDFNFDGHEDFIGQVNGAVANQFYNVYLYNPDTKQFTISEEYSGKTNPVINTETHYVLSINYSQGLPFYELSHVNNGHLAYLGSIQAEISDTEDVIFTERMYGYMDDNGTLAFRELQSETIVTDASQLSPLWESFDISLSI